MSSRSRVGKEKRRFGISITANVADVLDKLASKLGVDRSSLIEKAVRNFLLDHMHYVVPHECKGLMILTGRYGREDLLSIVESFRDVVHSYIHMHVGEMCIEILIVSGESSKIAELHSTLESSMKGCLVRYVPLLHTLITNFGLSNKAEAS